jgi:hypothetical protein
VSILSGGGGSAGGVWRCCWSAPSPPQLPPATSKNPPSFIASLLLYWFCGDGSNQYSIRTAEVNLFLSEKRGGKSHFGIIMVSAAYKASRSLLPLSMQTKLDLRKPVLLMALKVMLHAKLCLLEIIFSYLCWHPERICKALSSWGQRGQVRRIEPF